LGRSQVGRGPADVAPRDEDAGSELRVDDAIEHAGGGVVREVELARLVFPERADEVRGVEELGRGPAPVTVRGGPPHPARAEIAEDVGAGQLGHPGAPVPVAARDRAVAARVVILEDREGQGPVVAVRRGVEALASLHPAPPVVDAPRTAGRLEVHLLPAALADVGDEQVPGEAVEAEAPRVTQPEGPDLVPERVAGGHVRRRAVHVETQELPQERAEVLRIVPGIPAAPAVADTDVEVAVGAELELAAVVVAEAGMRDGEQDQRGAGVREVGIR